MSGAITDLDRLAIAIVDAHPVERDRAGELAMELHHVAAIRGLTYATLLAYVRDKPTRSLSGRDLGKWADHYAIISTRDLQKGKGEE